MSAPHRTASIAGNGGLAPLHVDPLCMGSWPADCRREIVEPVNSKIRERLESGEELPGCGILPRGESLRIR
jgi:hypothetical protein